MKSLLSWSFEINIGSQTINKYITLGSCQILWRKANKAWQAEAHILNKVWGKTTLRRWFWAETWVQWGSKPWRSPSGNSKCKGPEVRVCQACLRTFDEARGAVVASDRRRSSDRKQLLRPEESPFYHTNTKCLLGSWNPEANPNIIPEHGHDSKPATQHIHVAVTDGVGEQYYIHRDISSLLQCPQLWEKTTPLRIEVLAK